MVQVSGREEVLGFTTVSCDWRLDRQQGGFTYTSRSLSAPTSHLVQHVVEGAMVDTIVVLTEQVDRSDSCASAVMMTNEHVFTRLVTVL